MKRLRRLIDCWDFHARRGDAETLLALRKEIFELARKHDIDDPWREL